MSELADERLILYELCVQRPEAVVAIIRSTHAAAAPSGPCPPRILHEDFAGSAAVSRAWIARDPAARAVATDLHPAALEFARRSAAKSGLELSRLHFCAADVRSLRAEPDPALHADVIFVGNFSIGELHRREELLAYLRTARARLAPGGVFICDTYGGAAAFRTGLVHRTHPGRQPTERILYTWEQRSIDPFTARVVNALHFRVELAGEIIAAHFDAFIYHWRLWSVPELSDALLEAGFMTTRIIEDLRPGDGSATTDDGRNEHHIVCIAAS